jgi:endogenous inhibitor of DNA gyrase (YacG/DUF329 family)
MSVAKPQRVVSCPICAKPVPWSPESAYRPFCSQRCRQIDLGAWAAETYRVAGQGRPISAPGADELDIPSDT